MTDTKKQNRPRRERREEVKPEFKARDLTQYEELLKKEVLKILIDNFF